MPGDSEQGALPLPKEAPARRRAKAKLALLRTQAPRRRQELRAKQADLQARIDDVWGDALNLLEDIILEARALNVQIASSRRKCSVAVLRTHHSLYGRSLLTASEILTLLRTGHGHGALARWRTLFELTAVAEFVKVHGEEAAQRFVGFYPIEVRKQVLARWPSVEADGEDVPPEERALFAKLQAERVRLRTKYGKAFTEDLGWASIWFPQGRMTIKRIVDSMDLGAARSEYKRASYYVHAGARGSLDHHRDEQRGALVLLSTPNDELISHPGRLTTISLALATSILAEACNSASLVPEVWALGTLAHEAGNAFVKAHRRWVGETGAAHVVG